MEKPKGKSSSSTLNSGEISGTMGIDSTTDFEKNRHSVQVCVKF